MHSVVLLDETGGVLCDSLLWCDQRSEKEAAGMTALVGRHAYFRNYGEPSEHRIFGG